MARRIAFSLILLTSVLFFPFWLSVILALFGMIYFRLYLEAITVFFVSDLLFGVPQARFGGITFLSALVSAVVLFLIEFIKRRSILSAKQ
ncbi:MAG: hypothetical protein AAB500_02315 [Patescibacteria group bacterium]